METGGKRSDQFRQKLIIEEPLLTIITVVKNCETTLEKTILSVINQKCSYIEYVVIDGFSTDRTLNIIKKYDKEIDFWISEPDNGIYDAMNKAVSLSFGQYINFLNSGDVLYDTEVCNTIIDKIRATNSDILYGDLITWDEANGIERVIKAKPANKLWTGMICSHQSVFIKRSILETNPFNVKYKLTADYEQLLRLYTQNHSFTQVYFPVSKTRINGVSYSNLAVYLENMKIIHSFKPYSLHLVYFLPYILLAFFRKLIGYNLTTKARAIKWRYSLNH